MSTSRIKVSLFINYFVFAILLNSVGPSNNQNQFQSLNQTTHPNWQQNNINDSGNGLYSMFNNQD
ncbi:MAG: hypothetical protein KDC80_20915, partial [Saprospiraceae bacterium]|nr:hypothetical protein [Saprospiraceae bacterium]